LRTYDRMGLVTPQRTRGGGRRYSREDIAQLLELQRLSHEEGVNLAGIQRIIELEERLQAVQKEDAVLRQQPDNARGGESRGSSGASARQPQARVAAPGMNPLRVSHADGCRGPRPILPRRTGSCRAPCTRHQLPAAPRGYPARR